MRHRRPPSNCEFATFEEINFNVPVHQNLCYYPSCGFKHFAYIMRTEHDLFIFSDNIQIYKAYFTEKYGQFNNHNIANFIAESFNELGDPFELIAVTDDYIHFKSGNKQGVMFIEDNNLTVHRMINQGLKLRTFMGICDGCNEGGNYECVNQKPFMANIASLMGDKLYYIIDHSYLLETTGYARGCAANPKFGKHGHIDLAKRSSYLNCVLQAVLVYSPNGIEQDPSPNAKLKQQLILMPKVDEPDTQLEYLRPMREKRAAARLGEYVVTKVTR